jgi:serine/threonine-protein kinase HSL1 (negative regulator of Swe1 kinase)
MMEYCQGTELFQLLTKFGPLREDQALPLFRQMLSAVYYCQMINVAHRDIKPENMVVTFENRVKIIDFGLCSIAGKNIFMSTLCGSPHYVAPEILQSKEYDGRKADV